MKPDQGFDQDVRDLLEATLRAAMLLPNPYTVDQLKLMIVASNLESIASTFLIADSRPEVNMDLKQVVLGVLGTADWIKESFAKDLEGP